MHCGERKSDHVDYNLPSQTPIDSRIIHQVWRGYGLLPFSETCTFSVPQFMRRPPHWLIYVYYVAILATSTNPNKKLYAVQGSQLNRRVKWEEGRTGIIKRQVVAHWRTLAMGGSDCFRSVYNPWPGQDKETKTQNCWCSERGSWPAVLLAYFYVLKNPAEIEQNVSLISSLTRPCHSQLMNNNHLRYCMNWCR